jgi:uncharacterized protein (TIGR01732 family)
MCFGSCGYGYAAPTAMAPSFGFNFALIVVLFILLIIVLTSLT